MYKTNIKQLGKVERRLARDSETQGLTRGEFPGFSLPHIPQTGCWRNQRHRNAGKSDKKALFLMRKVTYKDIQNV